MSLYESDLEEACLRWFADLGYEVPESDNLDPESVYDERSSLETVILEGRLRVVLTELNPDASEEAIDEAVRLVLRHDAPTLEQNNADFQRLLTDGVTVEVAGDGDGIRGVQIQLFDFEDVERNDFVVANQLDVVDRATGTGQMRRPDVVVWVNGLPLGVIELKNPASEQADVWTAYNQIQTYKRDIPSLFRTNGVVVISDDVLSRIGSLTADRARFSPWRAVRDEDDVRVPPDSDQSLDEGERLRALVEGVFEKGRFLDLVRNFVTFERRQGSVIKKLAGYHQFHAVRRAVDETVRASSVEGDRRVGVVWHTQGSGKSLTMVFYAGKLVTHPAMQNPTLVVLTDRNDLDEQLFGTFADAQAVLRQTPVKAENREHLRELLKTASGGVYFTTVQKFMPPDGKPAPTLSDRRNIVVIADEAHRSQYGFKARVDKKTGNIAYGFAKHLRDALPNASFVGFTGTPVELEDKNTVEVFGDHISVYDIRRAVEDGATVPIYYENRLARIELDEGERPSIDPQFEEVTEGEEDSVKEGLKSQWSTLEAVVGTEKRLRLIAKDLVEHFEKRNQVMDGGKALVVCMSRRICAALYEEIVKLRPGWHSEDDDEGRIKVVMTGGASDPPEISKHVRSKARRELLANRFKDAGDSLQMVLVRDMWLTGFDAPCLHTLYVDKPMRGHNLMQAIARVNRVFGDKPGGLVVDYLGIATFLKEAMGTYTQRGGQGDATQNQEKAVDLMEEKLQICREIFSGFDYGAFFGGDAQARLDLLPAAREHVLRQRTGSEGEGKTKVLDGYDLFLKTVTELSKVSAIAATTPEFEAARDEIAFFQAVKAGLVKLSPGRKRPMSDLSHAVRQIVSNAIVSDEVIDVFSAAGLDRPDISVLSEEFLAEVLGLEHKNLAAAALERVLRDQIRARRRESVVQAKSFEEKLEEAVRRYLNRSIEASEVIRHLIDLAREIREAGERGEKLGLNKEELAFYDALAENESAREVLGDDILKHMALELTVLVRKNASIDWTQKRSVQAKLRSMVKRLLRKYGYPPDMQKMATENVLEQAKLLGINVTAGGSGAEEPEDWAEQAAGSAEEAALPYPIAVFDSLVKSQETGSLRVKTRLDGIERALTLVVACQIAWLRERDGGALSREVLAVVGKEPGKPVSMGTWLEYGIRLGRLLPRNSNEAVVRACSVLVGDDGKPSRLGRDLQTDVVPLRNELAHGVTVSDEQVRKHEAPLHEVWGRLTEALGPLRETRLVSKAAMLDYEGDKGWRYKLRLHVGPAQIFEIEEAQVSGKLEEEWAYLLREGEPPLSLAPIFFCRYSEEAGRHEVFYARGLALDKSMKVEGMGVASAHKVKVQT